MPLANAQAQGMAYVSFKGGGRAFVFGADRRLQPALERCSRRSTAPNCASGCTPAPTCNSSPDQPDAPDRLRAGSPLYAASRPSGYVAFLELVAVAAGQCPAVPG